MMENNNLLLYKLLCKDKVGGAVSGWGGITVGKGKEENEMKEEKGACTEGKYPFIRLSL